MGFCICYGMGMGRHTLCYHKKERPDHVPVLIRN